MNAATIEPMKPVGIPALRHLTRCHRILDESIRTILHFLDRRHGGNLAILEEIDVRAALERLSSVSQLHRQDEEVSLFPRLCSTDRPEAALVASTVEWLEEENRHSEELHADVDRLVRMWLKEGSLRFTDTWQLQQKLRELRRAYRAHAQIEESEVFPAAERLLCEMCVQSVTMEMLTRRGFRE